MYGGFYPSHTKRHGIEFERVGEIIGYFDGRQSWANYKEKFEQIVSHRSWSDREKLLNLMSALRGSAADNLVGYFGSESSYKDLVDRIDVLYGNISTQESYWSALQNRTLRPEDTYASFLEDIKILTIQAYPELRGNDAAIDSVCRQQFFWKLDDYELKVQLAMHRPQSLEEIKTLATLYESCGPVEPTPAPHKEMHPVDNEVEDEYTVDESLQEVGKGMPFEKHRRFRHIKCSPKKAANHLNWQRPPRK